MNENTDNKASYSPLAKYLPDGAFAYLGLFIEKLNLRIKITNSRKTKYGDYRPPQNKSYHQITVNGDLNKYQFLITFLHELAHLNIWVEHKNNVRPHGNEWKENFKQLLIFFIGKKIFPTDIAIALMHHLGSMKASTSSDLKLTRVLRKYDKQQLVVVEDIPVNTYFKVEDGRVFKKGGKRRTRYKCLCMDNKKEYLFSPFYQIIPIDY